MEALFSKEWSRITLLHEGRYYVVHRAMRMGQWFVLKSVKPGCDNRALHESLLLKEFNLGFGVRHTHVVRMLAMEEVGQLGQCIVMDYIDGDTLDKVLATHRLTYRQAVSIVDDVCQALDYLHSHQMVHRDVKPQNIIVDPQHRHAVLIDLGLADSSNYATLKMPAGTRHYIAPECVSEGTSDALCDIYSLGVVLEDMSQCSAGKNRLRHVAARCTRRNRAKRIQSVLDVAALLHKHSFEWWWAVAAAVAIAVAAAGVYWLFNTPAATTRHTISQDTSVTEATDDSLVVRHSPADSTLPHTEGGDKDDAITTITGDEATPATATPGNAPAEKIDYDYDSIIKSLQAYANDYHKKEAAKYVRAFVQAQRDKGEDVSPNQEIAEHYGQMEILRLNALADPQVKTALHGIARSTYFATRSKLLKDLPASDERFDSVMNVVMKRFYTGYSYDGEYQKDMSTWKNM